MMTEGKLWEGPAGIEIWLRFHDAVKVLCTKTGLLKRRLYSAYYDCGIVHLYSSNFKDDYVAKQLKCIEKIVNIGMPETNNIDGVFTQVNYLRIHWRQATKMALAIFEIYEYLSKYRYK